MHTHFMEVVGEAIRSWPRTFRLCLILVVAATMYYFLMGVPVLPGLMR
jgi:hypothetical protein